MNLKLSVLQWIGLTASAGTLCAATVPVPNSSFESPVVPSSVPALPFFEAWQHTAKPDWYVEDPNAPETQWANLAGVFPNPAAGEAGRLDNLDGKQAGFVFALPTNGIFQELSDTFRIAQTYQLTVALAPSSTIQPKVGSTLALSLFYVDPNGQIVPLATTNVAYNSTNFPNLTNFVDFSVSTERAARASDSWVGKRIGVMVVSTATQEGAGGIWDVDRVRVSASALTNGSFETPEVPGSVPAVPVLVGWQHTPKPDSYTEDPNAPETFWQNLAGVFPNPFADQSGNIANLEGKQAGYLFAFPSNGMFQESSAVFESGVFYQLSAGLVGSSTIPPQEGSTLELTLFYREGETNRIPVASRTVAYNSTHFTSVTNLTFFTVSANPLTNNHPAVGKHIGVAITSTAAQPGGIWDIDDVRITADVLRLSLSRTGDTLRVVWPTRAGFTYRLQTSSDLAAWSNRGTPLDGTGTDFTAEIPVTAEANRMFFRILVATP